MSLHEQTRWVVTYDIRDAKRGIAVHRYMKKQGVPLQYSVFMVEASSAQVQKIMLELEDLIAVHVDDVRAYRWPVHAEYHALGKSLLPEAVLLDADTPIPSTSKKPTPSPAVT